MEVYRPGLGVLDYLPHLEVEFTVSSDDYDDIQDPDQSDGGRKRKRTSATTRTVGYTIPPELSLMILSHLTNGQLVFVRRVSTALRDLVDHIASTKQGIMGFELELTWMEATLSYDLFMDYYAYLERRGHVQRINFGTGADHPIVCARCKDKRVLCSSRHQMERMVWNTRLGHRMVQLSNPRLLTWLETHRIVYDFTLVMFREMLVINDPRMITWYINKCKVAPSNDRYQCHLRRFPVMIREAVRAGNTILARDMFIAYRFSRWGRPNTGSLWRSIGEDLCSLSIARGCESMLELLHDDPDMKQWACFDHRRMEDSPFCSWALEHRKEDIDGVRRIQMHRDREQ